MPSTPVPPGTSRSPRPPQHRPPPTSAPARLRRPASAPPPKSPTSPFAAAGTAVRFARFLQEKPPPPPIVLASKQYEANRTQRRPSQDLVDDLLKRQKHLARLARLAKGASALTRREEVLLNSPRLPLSKKGLEMVYSIKGVDTRVYGYEDAEEALTVPEMQKWAHAEGRMLASLKYGYSVPKSWLIRHNDIRPASASPRRRPGTMPFPSTPGPQYNHTLHFGQPQVPETPRHGAQDQGSEQ